MNRIIILCIYGLALIGCGGGGGDGTTTFAGIYDVTLSKIVDECGLTPIGQILNHVHEVNQNDRIIALRSGRVNYSGTVDSSGTGFDVLGEVVTPVEGCAPVAYAIAYRPNNGDSDFNVGLAAEITCGGRSCSLGYTGVANKR